MEETEIPTEQLNEEIHHQAHASKEAWITQVALTAAILSVFAAVTALLSGHHANEAMIDQIKGSDMWAHYQSKSIKSTVLKAKNEILQSLGKPITGADKAEEYKKEQQELSEKATEKEHASEAHLSSHVIFARGVTMFQVAIAIAAVSVLVRRRAFWFVGIAFGLIGFFFLLQGLLSGATPH